MNQADSKYNILSIQLVITEGSQNSVSSISSVGIEDSCIWQESINVKGMYSMDDNSFATIEELYMRKGGLPDGACGTKDLLLSAPDYMC